MSELQLPTNIREFNEITGAIFAQLYAVFPDLLDIDPAAIAKTLGYSIDDTLESGRSFRVSLSLTAAWLNSEEFIHAFGDHPRSRVGLTAKGLAAMNAVLTNCSRWSAHGSRRRRRKDHSREGASLPKS